MKLLVYSIFDSKVNDFSNPFYMHAEGEAVRGFTEVANDPSTKIYKYAEDYTLFQLGEFDSVSGQLTSLITPKSILLAATVKKAHL